MKIEFMKMQRAGSPELPFGGPPFYPPVPLYPPPDDSGIDSDDTSSDNQPENDNQDNVSDSSSSEDNPVQRSPEVRYLRVTNGDNVIEAVRLNPGVRRFPVIMPPRLQQRKDGYRPINQNPDRPASPLYEVELTASEEDDDTSLMELVIPSRPSRTVPFPPFGNMAIEPRARYLDIICCLGR